MTYIATHAKVDALKQDAQPPYFAVTAVADDKLLARFFVSKADDVVADVFARAKNFADAYDPALITPEPEYNDADGQKNYTDMLALVNSY
jgi:hypothetical protein